MEPTSKHQVFCPENLMCHVQLSAHISTDLKKKTAKREFGLFVNSRLKAEHNVSLAAAVFSPETFIFASLSH